jgi:hypothetical protein
MHHMNFIGLRCTQWNSSFGLVNVRERRCLVSSKCGFAKLIVGG